MQPPGTTLESRLVPVRRPASVPGHAKSACLLVLAALAAAPLPAQTMVEIGQTTDLGGNSGHAPHYLLGFPVQVSTTVNVQYFDVLFRTSGYQGEFAVYSDSGDAPYQLVADTGIVSVTATGWQSYPFLTAPTLLPGQYWLMGVFPSTASVGFINSGTNPIDYIVWNFGNALPTTFGTPITYTGQMMNYAISTQAVPEPSTPGLLAIGGFLLLATRLLGCVRSRPVPR